jgi:2-polyprenyl-3-methyl-5-hydroxy-6-metoxy-1,4-benzoquinol methylase
MLRTEWREDPLVFYSGLERISGGSCFFITPGAEPRREQFSLVGIPDEGRKGAKPVEAETMDNTERNRIHFDYLYSGIKAGSLVEKIRHFPSFFDDALKTDTSWHGMYHGGFAARLAGSTVLELGCGDGLNALVMASLGARVVAVDISRESKRVIDEATKELHLVGMRAITGDFASLPFARGSFDFIIGKDLLHHLTHEQEDVYLRKAATLLAPGGEARFFEPATNSRLLDTIRWMIPVPGRPSNLSTKAFARWTRERDPHPARDNSASHFISAGLPYFDGVSIVSIGAIERLERLIPAGKFNRSFRRWAHRMNEKLPPVVRGKAARSQLIVYTRSKTEHPPPPIRIPRPRRKSRTMVQAVA